jgi:CheY-like chemotaxis protein
LGQVSTQAAGEETIEKLDDNHLYADVWKVTIYGKLLIAVDDHREVMSRSDGIQVLQDLRQIPEPIPPGFVVIK